MRPKSQRRPAPPRGRFTFGPLVGLRDSLDPMVSNDPKFATTIENMYPVELDQPSAFMGRPGFQVAGAQGGASGKRTGQLVTQFTKRDGTEYTVRIIGGQGIQTFDWSTRAWSTVVSVANLTTASITVSETARIYAVTFADTLVISDGTNTPFTWTGASGAGGLTKLTNAPVFYGQPVVYYAKLFAIKNTARSTIVWSEEADAETGYEADGYTNAWTLAQTDQEGFYALAPTDDALYCFRARSTTAIQGAVNATFSSTGTREAVAPDVGTTSPSGVYVHSNGRVYFVDADARPQVAVGASIKDDPPLWADVRETVIGVDKTALAGAITFFDPGTRLILFGVAELGQSDPSILIAVNPTRNVPVAVWRGFTFQSVAVVKNATGIPTIMHLSNDGYAYDHGAPDGTLWDDELVAGTASIRHVVEGPHLGTDARYEKRLMQADVVMRAESDATEIAFSYATPYGQSSSLVGSVAANMARWDQEEWDDFAWASGTVERRKAFGLGGVGRWFRPRISHEVAGEQFGFIQCAVEFTVAGDNPQIP